MKILFLGINSKFVHTNPAIRYIKKYLEKYTELDCDLLEQTINNSIPAIIKSVFDRKPDYLIVSTYIWNKEYVFKIIRELAKIMPELKIVLGGPEVSYDSEEVMRQYPEVSYIVSGEGEKTTLDLFTKDISDVKGVYYKDENDVICFNGAQIPIEDLDTIPFPYNEEELEDTLPKILYYESSRGCPFACAYCMSSIERSVRYFSFERVKEDLLRFLDKKVNLIKFIDRTFNLNKNHYMKIWKFLLENYNENSTFHFEISADLFDEEVIEFLLTIPDGYFQFEIGVQTINPETMKLISRTQDLNKLEYNVNKIKNNIHLHLDLIAGLPKEDYSSFEESFNFVYNMKPEMIQLGFLKILKGTPISKEIEKYDYEFLDFPPYEVLSTDSISYEEILLLKDVEEVLDFYYNSERFSKSIDYILSKFYDKSFKLYEDLALFYRKKALFEIAHKQVSIFNHLYDFYVDKNFEDIEIFAEYLKFDYFFMGKTGNYPEWLKRNTDKEKYNEILDSFDFKSKREGHKKTEFEIFNYDIINKKQGKKALIFLYNKKTDFREIF